MYTCTSKSILCFRHLYHHSRQMMLSVFYNIYLNGSKQSAAADFASAMDKHEWSTPTPYFGYHDHNMLLPYNQFPPPTMSYEETAWVLWAKTRQHVTQTKQPYTQHISTFTTTPTTYFCHTLSSHHLPWVAVRLPELCKLERACILDTHQIHTHSISQKPQQLNISMLTTTPQTCCCHIYGG